MDEDEQTENVDEQSEEEEARTMTPFACYMKAGIYHTYISTCKEMYPCFILSVL